MPKKCLVASRYFKLLAIFIVASVTSVAQGQDSLVVRPDSFLDQATQAYQTKISSKTIHRCPFEISCSRFLRISVEKHGTVKGFALFLDRYFYRENAAIPQNYETVVRNNRVVYRDEIPDSLITYLYQH